MHSRLETVHLLLVVLVDFLVCSVGGFVHFRAQIDGQNFNQTFIRKLIVFYLVALSENVNYIICAVRRVMKI